MVPAGHVARIRSFEMAGAGEPAQHPSVQRLLHRGEVLWCQPGGLGEVDLPVFADGEHLVDHAAVEQISKFALVIDVRVAREQRIKVPQELLFRADEVIR